MRVIRWILFFIILSICILFMYSNHKMIALSFFPLTYKILMPLWLIMFFCLLIGYIIGRLHKFFKKRI